MRRVEIPELEDLAWLPQWYRDLMTGCLERLFVLSRCYAGTVPLLLRLLKSSKKVQLVDFGTGASGPVLSLLPILKNRIPDLNVVLTDLYPNLEVANSINKDETVNAVKYLLEPIDMVKPPPGLDGARVMFTSFHHLSREQAKELLKHAAKSGEPVGIFEITGRTILHLMAALFIPLVICLITPFMSDRNFTRMFFTYLIPIVPLGCFIDGVISNFKTFSQAELRDICESADRNPNYYFEVGTFPIFWRVKGTYLLGFATPKST